MIFPPPPQGLALCFVIFSGFTAGWEQRIYKKVMICDVRGSRFCVESDDLRIIFYREEGHAFVPKIMIFAKIRN